MAREILLIRHGESTFNAAYRATGVDPQIIDAPLSETGHLQVAQTRERLARHAFDLVVSSPFTRAIQTALGIFEDRCGPLLIEALHRERRGASCDIGRSPALLAEAFPHVAFGHLDDPWWHDGEAEEIELVEAVHARIERFTRWLAGRPERRIAVVGHSAFFFHMTGHVFENCEDRPFEL